jgi:hypothetical protein
VAEALRDAVPLGETAPAAEALRDAVPLGDTAPPEALREADPLALAESVREAVPLGDTAPPEALREEDTLAESVREAVAEPLALLERLPARLVLTVAVRDGVTTVVVEAVSEELLVSEPVTLAASEGDAESVAVLLPLLVGELLRDAETDTLAWRDSVAVSEFVTLGLRVRDNVVLPLVVDDCEGDALRDSVCESVAEGDPDGAHPLTETRPVEALQTAAEAAPAQPAAASQLAKALLQSGQAPVQEVFGMT